MDIFKLGKTKKVYSYYFKYSIGPITCFGRFNVFPIGSTHYFLLSQCQLTVATSEKNVFAEFQCLKIGPMENFKCYQSLEHFESGKFRIFLQCCNYIRPPPFVPSN